MFCEMTKMGAYRQKLVDIKRDMQCLKERSVQLKVNNFIVFWTVNAISFLMNIILNMTVDDMGM